MTSIIRVPNRMTEPHADRLRCWGVIIPDGVPGSSYLDPGTNKWTKVSAPKGWTNGIHSCSGYSTILDARGFLRGTIFNKTAYWDWGLEIHTLEIGAVTTALYLLHNKMWEPLLVLGGCWILARGPTSASFKEADAAARTHAEEMYPKYRTPDSYWDLNVAKNAPVYRIQR